MKYLSLIILGLIFLTGCKSSEFSNKKISHKTVEIPENVWARTINYKFKLRVKVSLPDSTCQNYRVEVQPLNKLYMGDKPPTKLYLYDDDCRRPLRFDRMRYLDNEGWHFADHTMLHRMGVDTEKIIFEVTSWLFREKYL